ncbi:MAG: hypothetical protein SWQ30_05460 [Thermodesulfobacteriota bacterium]|nr:hypothetical protein [Thermodesulfobacteriota bacterium]
MNTRANKRLRQWVRRPEFRLVGGYPMLSEHLEGFGDLPVYEYLDYSAKPLTRVEPEMQTLGRKLSVRLE